MTTNQVNAHPERTICGAPVEFYSIMFADLYDPEAIPGSWKKFWTQFPKEDMPQSTQAFGVVTPIEGTSGKLHYVAGVEVPADYKAPEGFEVVTVPAGRYLECKHQGPISNLAQSYGVAYGVEFPASGLEMREDQHLEVYDITLNPMDESYEMGIYIPVK